MAKGTMKSKMMTSGGAKKYAMGGPVTGGGMPLPSRPGPGGRNMKPNPPAMGKVPPRVIKPLPTALAMGGMVKSKMMAGGGAVKSKMMAGGGMMKPKPKAKGK